MLAQLCLDGLARTSHRCHLAEETAAMKKIDCRLLSGIPPGSLERMSQNGCMRSRAIGVLARRDRNIRPQYHSIPATDKCLSSAIKRLAGAAHVDGSAVERAPFNVFLRLT